MGSSSKSSLPSSSENRNIHVTQAEFFAFYNIDRQLFSRLVFNLGREPSQAMQAAAFWLWLERINATHYVDTILSFPDSTVDTIFEETLLCLRAAESDLFQFPDDSDQIPIMRSFVIMEGLTLKFFYENRIKVLLGVGNIVQQICLKAFQDLIQLLLAHKPSALYDYYQFNHKLFEVTSGSSSNHVAPNVGLDASLGGDGSASETPNSNQNYHPLPMYGQDLAQGLFVYYPTFKVGEFHVPLIGSNEGASTSTTNNEGASSSNPVAGVGDILRGMNLGVNSHERFVPPSERTIFLTFSKGYPISEVELKDFLTRSFGDIIEALFMQEVEDEQPLYARLVVRNLSALEAVLGGQGKAKFSINGKHVWARKYVRKNPNSPPSSPTNH